MDPFTMPNLAELDDDALEALAADIQTRAAALVDDKDIAPDALADQIEQLAEASEQVAQVRDERATQAADRQARIDSALARLQPPAAAEEPVAEEPAEDPQGQAEEPVAADDKVLVSASTTTPSAAALAARRPAAVAAKPVRDLPKKALAFSGAGYDGKAAEFGTMREIAEAICRVRGSFSTNMPAGMSEKIAVATTSKELKHRLGRNEQENFGLIKAAIKDGLAQGLVASGACCTPLTPMYEFFRVAEAQTPWEDATPVIEAPRGGVRFVIGPDYTQADGAVGTYDCDDAAEDPLVVKDVMHVGCPTIGEEQVTAVTQRVRFDNLQYRTFPEQVEAFMEDVAVAFAAKKERFYLDALDAASKKVTGASSYGAARALVTDWHELAVAFRKRRGMRRNATVRVDAPSWAIDLIKKDLRNDANEGLDYLGIPDSEVMKVLSNLDLDVNWLNNAPTGLAAQEFAGAQAPNAAMNRFPTTVDSWMYAPGSLSRLDGGTLDLGLTRDSELNGTNDLELFMEEWLGVINVSQEVLRLTSTVCPNGTAAALTAPFACP